MSTVRLVSTKMSDQTQPVRSSRRVCNSAGRGWLYQRSRYSPPPRSRTTGRSYNICFQYTPAEAEMFGTREARMPRVLREDVEESRGFGGPQVSLKLPQPFLYVTSEKMCLWGCPTIRFGLFQRILAIVGLRNPTDTPFFNDVLCL